MMILMGWTSAPAPASTLAPASAQIQNPALTPAPVPVQLQLQPQLQSQSHSNLNPWALSFPVPSLPASLLWAPLTTPTPPVASVSSPPAPVLKVTFKPTKRDKAAGEDVYSFVENFFRVTKDKPNQQIENALMSLCSGDDELGKFVRTYSSSSPTAYLRSNWVFEWLGRRVGEADATMQLKKSIFEADQPYPCGQGRVTG